MVSRGFHILKLSGRGNPFTLVELIGFNCSEAAATAGKRSSVERNADGQDHPPWWWCWCWSEASKIEKAHEQPRGTTYKYHLPLLPLPTLHRTIRPHPLTLPSSLASESHIHFSRTNRQTPACFIPASSLLLSPQAIPLHKPVGSLAILRQAFMKSLCGVYLHRSDFQKLPS